MKMLTYSKKNVNNTRITNKLNLNRIGNITLVKKDVMRPNSKITIEKSQNYTKL